MAKKRQMIVVAVALSGATAIVAAHVRAGSSLLGAFLFLLVLVVVFVLHIIIVFVHAVVEGSLVQVAPVPGRTSATMGTQALVQQLGQPRIVDLGDSFRAQQRRSSRRRRSSGGTVHACCSGRGAVADRRVGLWSQRCRVVREHAYSVPSVFSADAPPESLFLLVTSVGVALFVEALVLAGVVPHHVVVLAVAKLRAELVVQRVRRVWRASAIDESPGVCVAVAVFVRCIHEARTTASSRLDRALERAMRDGAGNNRCQMLSVERDGIACLHGGSSRRNNQQFYLDWPPAAPSLTQLSILQSITTRQSKPRHCSQSQRPLQSTSNGSLHQNQSPCSPIYARLQ